MLLPTDHTAGLRLRTVSIAVFVPELSMVYASLPYSAKAASGSSDDLAFTCPPGFYT